MSVLSVGDREPFATGVHRLCFVHPDDPDLCVKVLARADDPRSRREQRRDVEDSVALRKRRVPLRHMSLVEDRVMTDLGVGLVSPLCRDANGQISRNVADIIREQGCTPGMSAALAELKRWLRDQRIPTRGLIPANLVAVRARAGGYRLVMIESLLDRRFDWLARRHRGFSNYAVDRRLRKLDLRIAALAEEFSASRAVARAGQASGRRADC